MYRWLLVTLMMTSSLFACATDKQEQRWTLGDTLKLMERVSSERELVAKFGVPHGVDRFNPGTPGDSYPGNWSSRDVWKNSQIFSPASLIETLPIGTQISSYAFGYGAALVGGALLVYVDGSGNILGYSYTKTLVGLETKARMHKRP